MLKPIAKKAGNGTAAFSLETLKMVSKKRTRRSLSSLYFRPDILLPVTTVRRSTSFRVIQDGEEYGPYDINDLSRTLEDTIISRDDSVAFEGDEHSYSIEMVRLALSCARNGDFSAIEDSHVRDLAIRLEEDRDREAREQEERQAREADEKKERQRCESLARSIRPFAELFLRASDGSETGPYLALQVTQMFRNGAIQADAQFYWSAIGSWWPLINSSLVNHASNPRWEYFALTINISGGSAGLLSAFSSKDVKDNSLLQLVKLGEEGWELAGIVPVMHGAIGAVSTDAAVAILKRKLSLQ